MRTDNNEWLDLVNEYFVDDDDDWKMSDDATEENTDLMMYWARHGKSNKIDILPLLEFLPKT